MSESTYRPDRRIPLRSLRGSAAVIGLLLVGALIALIVESDRFTLRQPTLAEVQTFGARLEATLRERDVDFFTSRLPGEAIVVHALADRELDAERIQQIAETFSSGLPGYLARLQSQVGAWGTFTLVSAHEQPARLIVRMSGQGLGYLELRLAKDSLGRVVCVDVISHLGGTSFRDTLRTERTPAVAAAQRELAGFLHQGQDAEGLAYWRALPADVRGDPELLLMRLAVAGKGSDAEELEAAALDLEPHFARWASDPYGGPDPRLTLLPLHTHRREFADALKLVDVAEARVGSDAAFDAMRARILLEAGRLKEAKGLAARAAEALPRDPYTQEIHLAASLLGEEWEAAVQAAKVLLELGARDADLERHRGWKRFAQSEVYEAWKRSGSGD